VTYDKTICLKVLFSGLICSLIIVSLAVTRAPEAFAEIEKPGNIQASSFLSKEQINGKYHSVQEEVANDGMYNHYKVKSPFATWNITSTISLHILINEISAIVAMKKVETDDTAI
jgi:hypothetical protein